MHLSISIYVKHAIHTCILLYHTAKKMFTLVTLMQTIYMETHYDIIYRLVVGNSLKKTNTKILIGTIYRWMLMLVILAVTCNIQFKFMTRQKTFHLLWKFLKSIRACYRITLSVLTHQKIKLAIPMYLILKDLKVQLN